MICGAEAESRIANPRTRDFMANLHQRMVWTQALTRQFHRVGFLSYFLVPARYSAETSRSLNALSNTATSSMRPVQFTPSRIATRAGSHSKGSLIPVVDEISFPF